MAKSPSPDEKRTLERQLQLKDQVVIKISEELRETKEKLAASEFEVKNRTAEIKAMREESKKATRGSMESTRSRPSTAGGDVESTKATFEHITGLENQIRAKDKEMKELRGEIALLDRQVKLREKEILKLSKSLEGSGSFMNESAKYEAEIRSLKKKLEESLEENRTLAQIEQAKTHVIEKLTSELENRKVSTDIVIDLENRVAEREREIADLTDELSTIKHVVQQKDIALEHLTSADVTRDERAAWVEERRMMDGQKRKALEKVAAHERTIKTLEARLQTLQQRITAFVKVIRESPVREPIDLKETSLSASQGSAAAAASGTDSTGDSVPAEMYVALEAAVSKLNAAIRDRDTMVAERDDAISVLHRKVEVLTKANASLERRLALDTAELRVRIDGLTDELSHREERTKQAEREAEVAKHGKTAVSKSSKRTENELYGQIADLRLLQQRRDAEFAEKEAALQAELDETHRTLSEENARLRTQLSEVLSLHDDIRHQTDAARRAKVAVVVHTYLGAVRAAADTLLEGVRASTGADAVLYRVPTAKAGAQVPDSVADLPVASVEQLLDVDAIVLGAPAASDLPEDMRVFLERAAAAWPSGTLVGKIGAAFAVPEVHHSPEGGQSGAFSATRGSLTSMQSALLLHGAALIAGARDGDESQAQRALGLHVADAAHKMLSGTKETK